MRPFPAADMKKILAGAIALAVMTSLPAAAQQQQQNQQVQNQQGQNPQQPALGQKALDRASFLQGVQAALGANAPAEQKPEQRTAEKKNLGDVNDPNSPKYKADKLATKAIAERRAARLRGERQDVGEDLPPPEIDSLQNVNDTYRDVANLISDDAPEQDISLDMRKESQKEAALSYGARGGLAKRNYQIMESMKGFDPSLDRVFDFRALLIKAPSGLLIEPPIVKESSNALIITEGGNEAAVADEIFNINKRAKIVSAPRDWRQYLVQPWAEVPPPPRVLWPRTPEEQASWNSWVAQGWKAGIRQAEEIFEMNTNRLVADYGGMVRYRTLLAQGMISEPYALHEDRGITGDKNEMRVGDRALRITGPSQFLTGAERWKPADR